MNVNFGDMNLSLIIFTMLIVFLGIGLAVYGVIIWIKRTHRISDRIEEFVTPEVQPEQPSRSGEIIAREISGSLFSRTVMNWFYSFIEFLGRFTPARMVANLEHKLTIAGNPSNLHARNFYAIRILSIIAGFAIALFMILRLSDVNVIFILLGIFIGLVAILLPDVWLNGRIRTRQDEIQRGLPDALDMLSVCASAGLGFDQSMQKISGYWQNELGLEFRRTTQEMEMGVSRSVALKNMSNRLEVDDLTQFIAIMIQAEKIGMSYADVLHSQALQLRVMRQVRAREIANKLPGKIIIPVVVFIFPAIIAVILGPALPTILDLF